MKNTRRWAIFVAMAVCMLAGAAPNYAQIDVGSDQGIPLIKNFSPRDYRGHGQNFAVVQDKKGLIYTANTSGVYEYDGARWRKIPTKNFAIPRSLAVDSAGRVCVGTRGDFGYLRSGNSKLTEYVSLADLLPPDQKEFSDVHSIFAVANGVYFASDKSLFFWNRQNKLTAVKSPSLLLSAFYVHGSVYAQTQDHGLMAYNSATGLRPAVNNAALQLKTEAAVMLPMSNGRILFGLLNDGLFLQSPDGSLLPFAEQLNDFFRSNRISSGAVLSDGSLAIGTMRGGVVVVNQNSGNPVSWISRKNGLQNDYVYALFTDSEGGVWAALDEGVDRFDISSPVTQFTEREGLVGSVVDIVRWRGSLYAATSRGVYRKSANAQRFEPVPGTPSYGCWAILPTEQGLLIAASEGTLLYDGVAKSNEVSRNFSLALHRSRRFPDMAYIGLLNGLETLRLENGKWISKGRAQGIAEEIYRIVEDLDGEVWAATPTKGLIAVSSESLAELKPRSRRLGKAEGLPNPVGNELSLIDGKAYLTSNSGIFILQKDSKITLEKSLTAGDSILWLSRLCQDRHGNFWASGGDLRNTAKYERKVDRKNGELAAVVQPLKTIADVSVSTIYLDSNGVAWFGGEDGIRRFDPHVRRKSDANFSVFLRKAALADGKIIFGGSQFDTNGMLLRGTSSEERMALPYNKNTIMFEFGALSLDNDERTEYQYLLEGFEQMWSQWSRSDAKEYTNLPDGKYNFRVRAKNVYGKIGKEAVFEFVVERPWFKEWWAYLLYLCAFAAFVGGLVKWRLVVSQKEKAALEQIIEDRTSEITRQKEEIEQQSGALAGKNDELAKINSIVKSINAEIDLDRLLKSIMEKILVFKGVRRGIALVRVGEADSFRARTSIGWTEDEQEELGEMTYSQISESYFELCEEVYEDVFYSGEFEGIEELLGSAKVPTSIVAVHVANILEGVLIFEGSHKTKGFELRLTELLNNLKEHIVAAFIKSKILGDLREKNILIEQYADITKKQLNAIQKDLEIASKIQHAILPNYGEDLGKRKEISLCAQMLAAKNVGGDFYDFFDIDDNRIGFVIADVSGKGMPAALFMAVSRTMLKSHALSGAAPGEVLETVNNLLCKENVATMFVTVFYGILDVRTGVVEYANGGHNLPYILRRAGETTMLKKTGGMGLAIMDDMPFQTAELTLLPGDIFFLYTDGVPEAMNIADELYSDDRLAEFLHRQNSSQPIDSIMKSVYSDVKLFAGQAPQSDDITVLAIRYEGSKNNG